MTESDKGKKQSEPEKKEDEYSNFERLTRKLLRVPKRELDDKLRDHERQGT